MKKTRRKGVLFLFSDIIAFASGVHRSCDPLGIRQRCGASLSETVGGRGHNEEDTPMLRSQEQITPICCDPHWACGKDAVHL